MSANIKRLVFWAVMAGLVALGLLFAFWPRPLPVDMAAVTAGPMRLTVEEEGETRVIDAFMVTAPIGGWLRRIEADPGDAVTADQTIVAQVEPAEPTLLDPRSEAEAQAQLQAAISAEALSRAQLERAQADLEFAMAEVKRVRPLFERGSLSRRDLDQAERELKAGRAALSIAQANVRVRQFELERVRAQLMSPDEMQSRRRGCDCVSLYSPVDGYVLRVLRESEGFVSAGTELIEIGDPERIELIVDFLSIDAVKVRPGQPAYLKNWGGAEALEARVKLVEPFGFTKISALGIEEQRVIVVLDLVSPPEARRVLGHGYQGDVEVVLWESEDTLKIPLTALFRNGGDWALFAVEDGRAMRRAVEVGRTTATEAQILSGVAEGEMIIVYPGDAIDDGLRVTAR